MWLPVHYFQYFLLHCPLSSLTRTQEGALPLSVSYFFSNCHLFLTTFCSYCFTVRCPTVQGLSSSLPYRSSHDYGASYPIFFFNEHSLFMLCMSIFCFIAHSLFDPNTGRCSAPECLLFFAIISISVPFVPCCCHTIPCCCHTIFCLRPILIGNRYFFPKRRSFK